MAQKKKTKTRYVNVNVREGNFVSRFFTSSKKTNFSDIVLLRKLLSNEKARILHILKTKKPKSIYALAKILGRDFKSVHDDLKILEKFSFVKFNPHKTGKRISLAPVLDLDQLQIVVNI